MHQGSVPELLEVCVLSVLHRKLLALSLAVVALDGVAVAAADDRTDAPAPGLVAAIEPERPALPAGSRQTGREGVESTAVRMAAELAAVPVDAAGTACPADRLHVGWGAPEGDYVAGAHVEPLGPVPTAGTRDVNGVVLCAGSAYAYAGFEARYDGGAWRVAVLPALADEQEAHADGAPAHAGEPAELAELADGEEPGEDAGEGEGAHPHPAPAEQPATAPPAPRPAAPGRPAAPAPAGGFVAPGAGAVDRYARYDPQRACDPVAKPGTVALRDLLLATYPVSRNLGITRACGAGGVSEHKEGRAFDWGVDVGVAAQRRAGEGALGQLLATDTAGNRHALARRLGVMYVIWNRRIWSAYSPERGWRPYSGASAHTDHVHLSLSWDGAMGRTSYWQGDNARLLRLDPSLTLASGQGATAPVRAASAAQPAPAPPAPRASPAPSEPDRAARRAEGAATRERARAQQAAERAAHEPEQDAAAQQARAQRRAAEEAARQQARAEAEARRTAEQQARTERRAAQQAAKEQARAERQAARQAAKQQARAERRAAQQAAKQQARAERQAAKQAAKDQSRAAKERRAAKDAARGRGK